MDGVTVAIVAFLFVAGAVVGVALIAQRFSARAARERLAVPTAAPTVSLLRWEGPRSAWARIAERLGRRVLPSNPAKTSGLRRKLVLAGYPNPNAMTILVGAKVGLALVLGLVYPVGAALLERQTSNPLFIMLVFAAIGFMLPNLWLNRIVKQRQLAIANALPDTLDLLTICVESGMSLDAALTRVVEQPEVQDSPLHEEIRRMNLEVRAGRARAEAFRALADRCGVQEMVALVTVLIQTDRLGTSVGKALRVHAETSRVVRRHRAEEQAYLVPVKMLFPTMIFLMPAFGLVAMGPSLLAIAGILRQMAQRGAVP